MPIHIVQIEGNDPMRDVLKIALDAAEPGLVLAQFMTGDEAIPYIQANAADIDLFVLDVRLPGHLSGVQLAFIIRSFHCPGFIVFTSGYGTPKQEILEVLHSEFVPKPLHIPELTQNLFKYHIQKPNHATTQYVEKPAHTVRHYEARPRSDEIQQGPTPLPMRRTMLSRKVATGEYKKAVVGSGLLQRLICKMRSL